MEKRKMERKEMERKGMERKAKETKDGKLLGVFLVKMKNAFVLIESVYSVNTQIPEFH